MNYWLLEISVSIKAKKVILVCLYRSPSGSEALFLEFFENWCENQLINYKNEVIITGDFNINMLKTSTYSNRLIECLNLYGLYQCIREYTHISYLGTESLIDLVITNNNKIECKVLRKPVFNNHSLLQINTSLSQEKVLEQIYIRKKLEKVDEFKKGIAELGFNYRENDINIKCDNFIGNIINVMNSFMPKISFTPKINYKPWFTMEILKQIKSRDDIYKKFLFTRDLKDWYEYKKQRNKVVNNIRVNKRQYYMMNINENRHDPKSMWKTLKNIISSNKKENYDNIEFNNRMCSNKLEIANKFNNYFINSIDEIIASIPKIDFEITHTNCIYKMECFHLLHEDMLEEVILSMPNKSSPDDIDINLYKLVYKEVEYKLLNIVNCSLETGIVPEILKISTVVPIRKVAKTVKCENFRPINTLPALTKILETIVYRQVYKYVEENELLCKYQSGFRHNHSCETALQYIIGEWKDFVDEGSVVVSVFLDLKRAFETVNRDILLTKLKMYGFTGTVLKWLDNYLANRKQRVKCNNIYSQEIKTTYGVPQGSILGPLLFILYINDVENIFKYCKFHLFADDMVVYINGNNIDEVMMKLNVELDNLYKYLCINHLKVNLDKTKAMIIGNQKKVVKLITHNFKININNTNIQIEPTLKYLGMIITSDLKLDEHINYTSRKISQKIYFLSRCGQYLNQAGREIIYNTIILPHYYFVGSIMYLSTQKDINKLQLLQNRAMRAILKCDRQTNVNIMLETLNWCNIKDLMEIQIIVFIHKIKLGIQPGYFINKLTKIEETHNHNTRQKLKYYIKPKNTNQGQNTLFFKGVDKYNKLPDSYKTLELRLFKIKVKNFYLHKS